MLNQYLKQFQIKNLLLISLAVFTVMFFMPSAVHAAYRDTIEAEGASLLYYWPMDESAGATSLTAAVGATAINLTGATAGASGQVDGTAVSFNGTSNFGATASSINLTAYNKVVVEALVYFNNYNTAGTLMGWELGTNIGLLTTGFYFAPKNGDSPNNKFTPAVKGDVGYNYAQYSQATAGAWHHVVAVYNKGAATNEVDLYVDGQLQTAESRPLNTNNTNTFGNSILYLMSRAGTSLFSIGSMQHLAIYSDLSSGSILAHAQATGLLQFTAGTLSESSHTSSTATVSWTSSTNGTGSVTEQLQRSPQGAGTWSNVSGATASPATDSGLNSETGYDYRVVYTDATPTIAYSNTVTITTSKIYPPYTANSDIVIAGPYDTAVSGSPANWGNVGLHTSIDILNIGHKYRIRQNGTISAARLYTVNKTALTGFYITVYRLSGSTYTLVGQSENLVSQLVAGDYATVTLASPITGVQEGDYYGTRVESPSGSSLNFFARTSQTGVSGAYIYDQASSPTPSTWTGAGYSNAAGSVMPIELYMQAPQVVFTGDSIISGHNANLSFLHTTETTNIASTIEKQFSNLTGYNYQNMGIGAQNTSQISARFTADVINLHPRIAIIEGGVNDLAQSVSKSTFIANWTSMLDAAQASNSITKILVMKILPWSNGTNVQMQTRDDWNASLTTLAAGYSKAIVVDASSYVGQFRAGGDAGNLWDIQAAYNSDGVHFTTSGHGQIAQALADNLPSMATTITSFNFASPSVTGTVDNTAHTVALTVPFGTSVTSLTPTIALAAGATISPTSGSAQNFTSPVTYTVTAQDGMTQQNYTVTVTVAANTSTSITSFDFTSPVVTGTVDNNAHTVALIVPYGTTITSLTPTIVLATGATISPNTGVAQNFTSPVTYTVTAQDGTTNQAYTATVTVALNTAKALTAFDFNALTPAVVGSVNEGTKTVTLTVPFGTSLSNLVPTITINGSSVSPASGIAHTFVDGVSTNYTVTAADSSTQIYAVTVNVAANTAKAVTVFDFNGLTPAVVGTVNEIDKTIALTVPYNTALTALVPTITITGASVSPASGLAQDFSSPVTYTVTAANASTQAYIVTVTAGAAPTPTVSHGGGGWSAPYPTTPAGGFTATRDITNSQNKTVLHFGFSNDITNIAISDNINFTPATYINATSSVEWPVTTTKILYIKYCNRYGRCSNPIPLQINAFVPIVSNSYKFYKNLSYRMTNSDVKELQKYLNTHGVIVAPSGAGSLGKETNYFGLLTYKALVKFQKSIGWSGTGFFGPMTRAFINK